MIAVLGLGSNLGDRRAHLAGAVRALQELDPGLAVSSLYETEPVGGPPQDPYLNLVVRMGTTLDPEQLLELAQRLERDAGRVRTIRNGPRTLDVDLLFLDDLRIDTPRLTVPHPRANERAFVLAPLEEVAPELAPPGWRERLGGEAAVDGAVHRVGSLFPS